MSSYGSINANSLTEMLMNNMILSKITSTVEKDFKFSFYNIVKILVLLSIGDIRNGTNYVITTIIDYLKRTPAMSVRLAMNMTQRVARYRTYNSIPMVFPEVRKYERMMQIDINESFMNSLYRYLIRNANNNCRFKRSINRIRIESIKNQTHYETLSDISVILTNILVTLGNNIDCNINTIDSEMISWNIFPTSPKGYTDILSSDQKYIVDRIHVDLIKFINYNEIIDSFSNDYKNDYYFSEFTIAKLLSDKYGFNYVRTIVDIMIVTTLLMHASSKFSGILLNSKKSFDETGSTTSLPYDTTGQEYRYSGIDREVMFASRDNKSNRINIYSWVHGYMSENGIKYDKFTSFQQSRGQSGQSCISLIMTSDDEFDHVQVSQQFINSVSTLSKKAMKKANIMTISIKTTVQKVNVDNPAYTEWEAVGKLASQVPPPKQITEERINKEIVTSKLNSTEKSIDTVYLRESDKCHLMTCIDQFKNKKEILRDLGFQNKLNVLLYGPPGTGKSTTISALASYFERDLYYVDLKEAKTNKDLQMIFEHANKNITNGGIIVFEDIDSMTSVVLDRKKTKEMSVTELSKIADNELSLEYLLNVLQGTLTIDDSIVIVTTNHIDHLDPAFYRDGRFDIKIELKLCDHHQIGVIYEKMLNRRLPQEILLKIEEDKYSPATIIYHIKNYIFKSEMPDEEIMKRFITL
jgi:hypothetical protein